MVIDAEFGHIISTGSRLFLVGHVHRLRHDRLTYMPLSNDLLFNAGQWQYASSELRSAKGLTNKAYEDQYKDQLITTVEEISEAFWNTKWGRAMRAELMNNPFMK